MSDEEKKVEENDQANIDIKIPKLLRGFKDILPADEVYWDIVLRTVVRIARDYNFSFISTPIIEEASLFERSVGEASDIVSKEMFRFLLPKSDEFDERRDVVLRPEGTAPVVRAYLEHGMLSLPQPVKLWYIGQMFRYERPQSGRYRQHHQFGIEVLGDPSPVLDAQVIIVAHAIFKSLGLNVIFTVNSLGDSECRAAYHTSLFEYFEPRQRQLAPIDRKRLKTNPLRILDSKEEQTQELLSEAPQILDYISQESRDHFVSVLEYLDELDLPYALNPRLVRGLDYYNRTTFEVFIRSEYEEKGPHASALSGGGRYDNLSKMIGGKAVPGIGFAQGIERIIIAMKEHGIEEKETVQTYDVFIAQLGDDARRKVLRLFETLRNEDMRVAESFSKDGLSAQLERANKCNAKFTVILGQKEIIDGTVIIRDMASGIQEEVNYDKLIPLLKKRIEQHKPNNGVSIVGDTQTNNTINVNKTYSGEGVGKQ